MQAAVTVGPPIRLVNAGWCDALRCTDHTARCVVVHIFSLFCMVMIDKDLKILVLVSYANFCAYIITKHRKYCDPPKVSPYQLQLIWWIVNTLVVLGRRGRIKN